MAEHNRKGVEPKGELDELSNKCDHLFHTLTQTYSRLYLFDRSIIGRVFRALEILYAIATFRPTNKSSFRLIIEDAKTHAAEYGINYQEFENKDNRIYLIKRIIGYGLRHPYLSLRSINRYRINNVIRVLVKGDIVLSSNWIEGRFPADTTISSRPIVFPTSDAFDSLELDFPHEANPIVSIVIPAYNQYRITISCLISILENTQSPNYEVIIADDCSSDLTITIQQRVRNIKVVRNETNQGFVKNCNSAVKVAKGEYVVLLNNDTNVQPEWLEKLLQTIRHDNTVGLVGPKLLFENGVLQEAGGIIWRDGNGWNYGRGKNPLAPEYNYRKEVDYISGACILVRKSIWDEIAGFSEKFCPAYYEDTDLAFRLRQLGYKVIYQPMSEVVHFEGVSNGVDINSGIKQYQKVNQTTFYNNWKGILETDHFPEGDNAFLAKDRSMDKVTVVFVDHYVPFYDQDAGSRSTFLYIKIMVDMGINVKFIGANFFPHQPYTEELQQMGVEVLYGERYARNWKTWFEINCRQIDVIYLHRPHIAEDFIDFLVTLKNRPKLIYFGHDLHYLRTLREAELTASRPLFKLADDWKKRELAIFNKVDLVYYPSTVEVDEVTSLMFSANVKAIPLYPISSSDPANYQHENRSGIIFVGGFNHTPNVDAVLWFANEIMPIIRSYGEDINLNIVGSNVPEVISKLERKDIIVQGFLSDDDLVKLYSKVRVCVIPLRFGAGVKGKVLEALQAGLPIVTTHIGAEGIPDANSVLNIVDEPAEMASIIVNLHHSNAAASEKLHNYHDFVEKHFSVNRIQNVIKCDFLPRH